MDSLDEALGEFLIESGENLDQLDRDLVAAESGRRDAEMMGRVFRAVHTIKGTCGFLALAKLERVAHAGESLLCELRGGRLDWSPEVSRVLLRLTDALRRILASVGRGEGEGDEDDSILIRDLQGLTRPSTAAVAAPTAPEPMPTDEGPAEALTGGSSVRVDVALLDRLMNLVGELVLTRNQVLKHAACRSDPSLAAVSQRLSHITTELQEGVMKARMQPIGVVWGKFPRVVRDLASSCGKLVKLAMEGRETELDRTLIEAIRDPLTHVVRNAVDHGIEAPEARKAAGKPQAGTLRLRAYHENGQVVIEVSDDGAGIDPARVARKAIERGLISREQAAAMGERELTALIFLPGFSTADRVTNVSGRGVGMDVVKTNIEAIGGTVDVHATPGRGTTLRVKIPLTLAIIPALIVANGGDRYAIPQANLLELVRLGGGLGTIETLRDTPVHRLRGKLLPLIDLDAALGLPPRRHEPGHSPTLVVLHADGRRFGLIVAGVVDTEEIVVKPLGKLLKGLPLYAGAAVMGDGRVALILDVQGLARGLGDLPEAAPPPESGAHAPATRPYLICRQGERGRFAVPLEQVARLEKIPAASVEHSGGREVVQYGREIMPLFRLASTTEDAGEPLRVIVHSAHSGSVGFVVDEIVDVVEDDASPAPGPPEARGRSAVIRGRVTDLLDLPSLLDAFALSHGGG